MKYIRTKDGRILSLNEFEYDKKHHWYRPNEKYLSRLDMGFIQWKWCFDDEYHLIPGVLGKAMVEKFKREECKFADTIEELIMPGDLVRYDVFYMSWIEKDRGNQIRGVDMHLIDRKSVCDLWVPVGDNPETYPDFKLVASKNRENGRLELL